MKLLINLLLLENQSPWTFTVIKRLGSVFQTHSSSHTNTYKFQINSTNTQVFIWCQICFRSSACKLQPLVSTGCLISLRYSDTGLWENPFICHPSLLYIVCESYVFCTGDRDRKMLMKLVFLVSILISCRISVYRDWSGGESIGACPNTGNCFGKSAKSGTGFHVWSWC